MSDTYYIDIDTRPKTKPCPYCARDVQEGSKCECAPSQPRTGLRVVKEAR